MPTTPPPDVPPAKEMSDYMRRFSTWVFQELEKKVPKQEAVPHIFFYPDIQKNPNTIMRLHVHEDGTVEAHPVPLGKGGT